MCIGISVEVIEDPIDLKIFSLKKEESKPFRAGSNPMSVLMYLVNLFSETCCVDPSFFVMTECMVYLLGAGDYILRNDQTKIVKYLKDDGLFIIWAYVYHSQKPIHGKRHNLI
tara:strand:- start:767 stop:1105 length:339 start_codon:yes stop_codon:yes gene_type:complete